jgi:hypothetical protein
MHHTVSEDDNVRVVICNKRVAKTPDKCTTCVLSKSCKALFQVETIEIGNRIKEKYLSNKRNVQVYDCTCEAEKSGFKEETRINITRTGVLSSGGCNESNYLREQRRGYAQS